MTIPCWRKSHLCFLLRQPDKKSKPQNMKKHIKLHIKLIYKEEKPLSGLRIEAWDRAIELDDFLS